MSEGKNGEVVSLADRIRKKETEELGEPTTVGLVVYLLEEYLTDELGLEKLTRALDKKIADPTDREDIFNAINQLLLADDFDDDLAEEIEIYDNEFGLLNILCSLAKKSKEEVVQEFNEFLMPAQKKMKSVDAEKNSNATVIKFPTK